MSKRMTSTSSRAVYDIEDAGKNCSSAFPLGRNSAGQEF
jgi:hypothetical protein